MVENVLLSQYGEYMLLQMHIDTDHASWPIHTNKDEFRQAYVDMLAKRYQKMMDDPLHIDAGVDLLCPDTILAAEDGLIRINHFLTCAATIITHNRRYNTGFYMYPRSSITKTPLRLANNVGIIDAGYRGHLIGVFDCVEKASATLYHRYLQICAPGLIPIVVELVDSKEELGLDTARGNGGFGSTGK